MTVIKNNILNSLNKLVHCLDHDGACTENLPNLNLSINRNLPVLWGAVVLWAYSSAHGAKGPGIESPWRQEFIIKCMFCNFEKIKLRLGPTFKKKKKKKKEFATFYILKCATSEWNDFASLIM